MSELLSFCTVCASNQNRSMEAHKLLKDAGYKVRSYGTGSAVRLPGPSIDKPNVFQFGTPYSTMREQLMKQDVRLHQANGVLKMIDRNEKIKEAPQRWPYIGQEPQTTEGLDFDIVFTCEERCFDAVVEDFMNRSYNDTSSQINRKLIHVINVEIRDDYDNALIGGQGILDLAQQLEKKMEEANEFNQKPDQKDSTSIQKNYDLFEDSIPDILAAWQKDHPNLPLLYSVCYN